MLSYLCCHSHLFYFALVASQLLLAWLTLLCRHVEEQRCPGLIRNNILLITTLHVSLRLDSHDELKYQAGSLTMQLTYVSSLIYSFTCHSSKGKTNSSRKGSLFELWLHSCEAALPLSDDWLLVFSPNKNDKNAFLPLIIALTCFCLPSVWTAL